MNQAKDLIRSQYQAGKSFADIAGALAAANLKTPSGLTWDANRVSSTVGNMKLHRTDKAAAAKKTASVKPVKRRNVKAQASRKAVNFTGSSVDFNLRMIGLVLDTDAPAAQQFAFIRSIVTGYQG